MDEFDTIAVENDPLLDEIRRTRDAVEENGGDRESVMILLKNVDNPKWEIRKVVAEAVLFIPENESAPFMRLLSDPNAYVQSAAKIAYSRKSLYGNAADKKRSISPALLHSGNILENKFGRETAEWVRAELEKAYDRTVGAAAHDIYGILSPMKDQVNAIEEISQDPLRIQDLPSIRMYVQRLRDRIETIERLVGDMRLLAKETSKERRSEQVKDVVNAARGMVLDVFRSKNRDVSMIECFISIPERLTFKISRIDMIRAIYNLLKNAYESFLVRANTFRAGKIEIVAEETCDGCIAITIRDTGIGMSALDLETYLQFNPGVTSKKETGTGFGLAIAFRKIRDHEGTLAVTSQMDVGTTVKIFIPKDTEARHE